MKYYNCPEHKPWMDLDKETKQKILESKLVDTLDSYGVWVPVESMKIKMKGNIYRAPMPEEKADPVARVEIESGCSVNLNDVQVTNSGQGILKMTLKSWIKPILKTKKKVKLGPEDIKQGDVIRVPINERSTLILEVSQRAVECQKHLWSFEELKEYGLEIRSIGETAWRPCYKEVEVDE